MSSNDKKKLFKMTPTERGIYGLDLFHQAKTHSTHKYHVAMRGRWIVRPQNHSNSPMIRLEVKSVVPFWQECA